MWSNLLKSKLFILICFIILALTLFYLGKELQKKYIVYHEVRHLQNQIAELDSQNKDIIELINYFKTPEYKERQARSLLNLQKPGEFAVALPGGEEPSQKTAVLDQKNSGKANFIKWWDYFFGASH